MINCCISHRIVKNELPIATCILDSLGMIVRMSDAVKFYILTLTDVAPQLRLYEEIVYAVHTLQVLFNY